MTAVPALNAFFETHVWTFRHDLDTCVTVLANSVARGMAQIAAPHGLAHVDFALLGLFLRVDEWTTTQLADALPLAPSNTSRSVAKLVDKGLIQRRRLLSDRRVVMLTLTVEGRALTQELHRSVQAYDSVLSDGVSEEEMAVFAAVSSKVMANCAASGQTRLR